MNAILSNDYRRTDGETALEALGTDAGRGVDAYPKAFLKCVQLANDGVFGPADAHHLYAHYLKGKTGSSVHKGNKDSLKAQVSKLKQALDAGSNPNIKNVFSIFERAQELLAELPEDETKTAAAAYQDVARAVKKATAPLSDDEITACLLVSEGKPTTEETKLKQAIKALEAAQKMRDEAGEQPRHEVTIALSRLNEALSIIDAENQRLAFQARQRLAA
jgi:hypothetical protein